MKKVSELEGAELDYWVAKAEGKKCEIKSSTDNFGPTKNNCYEVGAAGHDIIRWDPYSPSCNWSQGGPIIERERMTLDWGAHPQNKCRAFMFMDVKAFSGDTPLIAAMRAYVASKFGETIGEDK